MEHLILARHAESVFNVRGVLNGDPSVPGSLTERGREQARALGESIADDPIDLCVTTAFERTRQTADIALQGREIPRVVIPELDDPPGGDFELRPYTELAAWLRAHGRDAPLPGFAHGWFVAWIRGAALRSHQPRGWAMDHAKGYRFSRGQVERGVAELREDPYRYLPR